MSHVAEPTAEPTASPPSGSGSRRWWPRAAWAGGGTLAVVGAAWVGGYLLAGDKVPDGTTVAGVAIGGQSAERAEATLTKGLADRVARPVVLRGANQQFTIVPREAGLSLDAAATVLDAGGTRSWNPVHIVRAFTGGGEVEPVVTVREQAMTKALGRVSEALDVEPVEPQITFGGEDDITPRLRQPANGREVDVARTEQDLREAFLAESASTRTVPVKRIGPTTTLAEAKAAIPAIAVPAVSAPVRLSVTGTGVEGTRRIDLRPASYAPALTITGRDGEMVATVDATKLEDPLAEATKSIGTPGRDAKIVIRNQRPVVLPSRDGTGVPPAAVAKGLPDVLTKTGDARALPVTTNATKAAFSTEDARALGVKERVSLVSTYYPYAEYRNVNQSRAAALIDNYLIRPGETFSFNDTVGERTKENGFTEGTVISNGVFKEDLGGGVSQVATTTYNAGFYAGLVDVTHKPHSFYIDRYPEGREATVAFPTVDLKIKNDTKYGVVIHATVQKSTPSKRGRMTVSMWSTKQWTIKDGVSPRRNVRYGTTRYDESPECVSQGAVPGFEVTVYRYFERGGKRVRTEQQVARYNPADRIICGPDPAAAKPPKP